MKLKKIVLIVLVVLSASYLIILSKNIYLYSIYRHGGSKSIIYKTVGEIGELAGTWQGVTDIWQEGYDWRQFVKYEFNADSAGLVTIRNFNYKINGEYTRVYSWRSLLPFDKNKYSEHKYKVIVDPIYIKEIKTDSDGKIYTSYYKYKINADSLFISYEYSIRPYSEEPVWRHEHLKVIKFSDLFKYWFFKNSIFHW